MHVYGKYIHILYHLRQMSTISNVPCLIVVLKLHSLFSTIVLMRVSGYQATDINGNVRVVSHTFMLSSIR